MDMTISKKDRALLIALAGILTAAATYWFVYTGFTDMTAALESKNAALKTRVDTLQELVNQQEELAESTLADTQEAQLIMGRFPAEVREEDLIMLAVNLQNYAPFEAVDSVTMDAAEQKYQFADVIAGTESVVQERLPSADANQAAAAGDSDGAADQEAEGTAAATVESAEGQTAEASMQTVTHTPVLYEKDVTILCATTYEGLKRAVSYVLDRNDRTGVAATASYDITTGILTAGIKAGTFYVTGTDKQYLAPDIPYVQQGTDNIFGTISIEESSNETEETEETN
ncbi:MAG: hypothetical protein QM697_08710 [Lachnospiraceae bacterium]